MYFLDTNALYSYIGRNVLFSSVGNSIDEKGLRTFLDGKSDVRLPVSSYMEALVRFRYEISKAQIVNDFINDKKITLFNNVPSCVLSPEEAFFLRNSNCFLKYIFEMFVTRKVQIEASMSSCFFEIIILVYSMCRLLNKKNICNRHYKSILKFVQNETAVADISVVFKGILTKLYHVNNCNIGNEFKKEYMKYLKEVCKKADSIVDMISEHGIINLSDKGRIEECNSNMRYSYLKNDTEVMESIIAKECDPILSDASVREHLFNAIAMEFSSEGEAYKEYSRRNGPADGCEKNMAFKSIQIAYLKDVLFPKWLKDGSRFDKNDIYDFLFLGCKEFKDRNSIEGILVDNSSYLISFDKKLIRFIGTKDSVNEKIIKKYL